MPYGPSPTPTTEKPRSEGENSSSSRELIGEEILLDDRPELEISHWWKTSSLLSYFLIVSSGIASSISVGDLLAAFQNECIFYGKLTLVGLNGENFTNSGNLILTSDNVVVDKYGSLYDCQFCEFGSVFSVVFGGMLFAMVLQCGRGGINLKNQTRSWSLVLPSVLINIIFFIVSSVIFAKTVGGLSFFCSYILRDTHSPENVTSCQQVLSFRYPWDPYGTDLYLDFVFAQVGAVLTFVGWMSSLTILIFRCLLGVDFVAYRVRSYAVITTTTGDSGRKLKSRKSKSRKTQKANLILTRQDATSISPSASSSPSPEIFDDTDENQSLLEKPHDDLFEDDSAETETSFTTVNKEHETKKLI